MIQRFRLLCALALVTLATACVGAASDLGGDPPEGPRPPDRPPVIADPVTAGPDADRRLTFEEYFNSIEVTTGVDLDPSSFELPRDNRAPAGFRNANLLLSPARVRAYDAISREVVLRMDWPATLASHAACTDFSDECQTGFVRSIGQLLHRRPLPDTEIDRYVTLFAIAREEGADFETGAHLAVRALLQAPRFLYRLEDRRSDEEMREVDDFELATRVAFLFWNSAPDAELLRLASDGTIRTELETQATRLLEHPRAERALRQYIESWLHLDAINSDLPLAAEMKEETYRLFQWLVWDQNTDLMEAFSSQRAEISPELAEFYGLTAVGSDPSVYDLSAIPERTGFLTHAGLLTARTINPSSSMIDRGLFVLNDVFCEKVPEPDGEALREAIETQTVPETSGLSQRERFARQSEDPLCASCHGRFDPLGVAFENFGGQGQFNQMDGFGNTLTGSGEMSLDDEIVRYENVTEFVGALAASPSVARCLVHKSLQHAYGRELTGNDRAIVDDLFARFSADGQTYRSLLLSIVTHPDFGLVEAAP